MTVKSEISKSITKLRKELDLSQTEFAKMIDTTKTTISHWEHETHTPDAETLVKISQTFNVPICKLFGEYNNCK